MEKFRFLEHTADAKFQAFGKTIEEAFANAALAVFSIMTDTEKIEQNVDVDFDVKGDDLKSLLVNFLGELLVLLDSDNFLLHTIKDIQIDKKEGKYLLLAAAVGDHYSDKYDTSGDVKAITYNDMEIREEPNNCMVQVVVDI